MLKGPHELTALIGSRICHDLISPLGAVSNGLELMEMNGGGGSPEFSLIRDSITSANARIRFFRIAFGMASDTATLVRAEIAAVIDDSFRGTRLAVVWKPRGTFARREVKLTFLCLMCVESAMARGGEVVIRHVGGKWEISASSDRLNCTGALWENLTRNVAPAARELTPRDAHFAVMAAQARALDKAVDVRLTETAITMTF